MSGSRSLSFVPSPDPASACPVPRRAVGRSSCAAAAARALAVLGLLVAIGGAARAATVEGVVSDPGGRPVPGARVHVRPTAGAATRATTADAEGRYRVDALSAGRYSVSVERAGFRSDPAIVDLAADAHVNVPVVLRLSALAETVVVSAAQAEAPLSNAPASVTVLSADDLDRQQVDTLDTALRQVPGLTVTRSGARGALSSVFPRGGESDYTLVLLDGVRLNAFGGGLDLAMLAAANIERIEIVRGPQSALFGADAIGGVVHVVSRTGGPLRGVGVVEGGSDATTRVTASGAGGIGRWSWGAGGERLASDGFNGERTGAGTRITNDDFERHAGSVTLGYAAPGGLAARGAVHAGTTDRGYPGAFGSDPNGSYPGLDTVSRGENDWRAASLAADLPAGGRVRVRAGATWADLDSRFTSPFGVSDSETRRATARLQGDLLVASGASVSAGVELLDERARNTFITGTSFQPVPVQRRDLGSFAELRLEAAGRWFVTGGVRVDRLHRDPLEPDPLAGRPVFDDDVVVAASPRVAASWFVRAPRAAAGRAGAWRSGWTRAHASAGTGIRPADALEIAFTDNPNLQPERSTSVDLGVEHAWRGGAVVVDATAFRNRYDDLIVAVGRSFADASQYRTDNISNARASGVELTLAARGRRLDLRVAYTRLDTRILAVDGRSGAAPPPFVAGDPLIRRPRHRVYAQATFTAARWSAFARLEARGRVLDVDPTLGAFGGTVEGPGFAAADAGTTVRAWRGIDVFARVTNLFDRRYEEIVGFPVPGRALMTGVRVAAGR